MEKTGGTWGSSIGYGLRYTDLTAAQGLKPGDRVIVDGLQKVFMPGMPVNAKTVAMTASTALH